MSIQVGRWLLGSAADGGSTPLLLSRSEDVDDRSQVLIVMASVFLGFATLGALMRFYVKTAILKGFTADDWLMLTALILDYAYTASIYVSVHYGLGRDMAVLSENQIYKAGEFFFVAWVFQTATTAIVKVAFAVFYFQFVAEPWQRVLLWSIIGLVIMFSIAYEGVFIFGCDPVTFDWSYYVDLLYPTAAYSGTCVSINVLVAVSYTYAALCCFVDWVLGLLPIYLLWNHKMNIKAKISVMALLSLGAVASFSTILRIRYTNLILTSTNYLYDTVDLNIWMLCEPAVAILVGGLAVSRPLFRKFLDISIQRLPSNAPPHNPSAI